MSSMFVRLSVFQGDRQLDVSLPAQRPVIDLVDDVVDLLDRGWDDGASPGEEVTDAHAWVLSSPATGVIEPGTTLASHGITDGHRLYLSRRTEAARSPFVDDVMAEVRHTIADTRWRWSGRMRSGGLLAVGLAVLGLVVVLAGPVVLDAGSVTGWSTQERVSGGVLAVAGVVALGLAFWRPQGWVRWVGLAFPLVVAVLAGSALQGVPADVHPPLLMAVVALCGIPAALAAGRGQTAGGLAGSVALGLVAVVAAVVSAAVGLGASVLAIAAWGAWVPVLLLLAASVAGLNATGLPTLLRRNDAGDPIERDLIRRRAIRSEALSRAVVWAATGLAVLVTATLAAGPYWQQGLVSALLSVVLLLRTNGFSDARVIAPLLVSGVGGLALTVGSFAWWGFGGWSSERVDRTWWLDLSGDHWASWLGFALTALLLGAVLALLQGVIVDELQEARLAKVFSTVDVIVCLAFIPVILVAQGVFTYYWATT